MKRRKKRTTLFLLLLFIWMIPFEVLAAYRMKTTTDLRLRQSASTASVSLGVIPAGTEIDILKTTATWAQTQYSAKTGYVAMAYLAATSGSTMRMVTIDLRLRSGPSSSSSILAVIPKHTAIPVFEQSGSFIKTIWSGKTGWVGISYTKRLQDLPKWRTTTDLRLRTGPGTGYLIVRTLPKGTVIPVLTSSGNWVKTWAMGSSGWLSKTYLSSVQVVSRPASPPSYLLNYPNTRYAWSHAYPQDSKYGFPEFNSHYRYGDRKVHLTIDSGYENGLTAKYLDVLKAKGVKVTFYLTGYYMRTQPALVRRMIAEGHLVANHSDTHPDSVDLMAQSMQLVYNDLLRWESEYKKITGTMPRRLFYRPPSGVFSERLLALTHWMGYQTELYEVALRDWEPDHQLTPQATYDALMKLSRQGSVVLIHSVSSSNLAVLDDYIDAIRAKGWDFYRP